MLHNLEVFLAFRLHNSKVFFHNPEATVWMWQKKVKKVFFMLCMEVAEEPVEVQKETVMSKLPLFSSCTYYYYLHLHF